MEVSFYYWWKYELRYFQKATLNHSSFLEITSFFETSAIPALMPINRGSVVLREEETRIRWGQEGIMSRFICMNPLHVFIVSDWHWKTVVGAEESQHWSCVLLWSWYWHTSHWYVIPTYRETQILIKYCSGYTPPVQANSRLVQHSGKTFLLQDIENGCKGIKIIVSLFNTS